MQDFFWNLYVFLKQYFSWMCWRPQCAWGPSVIPFASLLFLQDACFPSSSKHWAVPLSPISVVPLGCPALSAWPHLLSRVLFQLAAGSVALSFGSFAHFLYSLTYSGDGSSSINVLCTAPWNLGCISLGGISHPSSPSLQNSGAKEIILFPGNLVSSVIKPPISWLSVQQFGGANILPDQGVKAPGDSDRLACYPWV